MASKGRSKVKRKRRKSLRAWQPDLPFTVRGGKRRGAGRPKEEGSGVSHLTRSPLAARFPVHVTLRVREGMPSLRRKGAHTALRRAFLAGRDRFGFRLNHYSIQSNHIHLIVEAKDRTALTRGMQGLSIRIARALNRAWDRKGKLFADRYHDHILRTPREVKNALAYVLRNELRHNTLTIGGPDPHTSGEGFDGWRNYHPDESLVPPPPIVPPHTWLLNTGWRRHGLIVLPIYVPLRLRARR
jgi:REP element-mobilizing transposase RayT